MNNITLESRVKGSLYGLYIGDALAMPVHWYYDRDALKRDYGYVTDYMAPKNPHPGSILSYKSYGAVNKKGEILHDQAKYWGKKGIHYHQFLKAGENTLNLLICSLLIESLIEKGDYDADDYLMRYINFMTVPGNHRDTYIEESHRYFFTEYAKGKPPRECGMEEKHIGGLVGLVPIILLFCNDPGKARKYAFEHLSLSHLGKSMESAASIIIDILLTVIEGGSLRDVIIESLENEFLPFKADEFLKWQKLQDEEVVGGRFSAACYVQESIPSLLYLAYKYHDNPEQGIVSNTNLGGDNAYRGAVLGAILGAANGINSWPERLIRGLSNPPRKLWKKQI